MELKRPIIHGYPNDVKEILEEEWKKMRDANQLYLSSDEYDRIVQRVVARGYKFDRIQLGTWFNNHRSRLRKQKRVADADSETVMKAPKIAASPQQSLSVATTSPQATPSIKPQAALPQARPSITAQPALSQTTSPVRSQLALTPASHTIATQPPPTWVVHPAPTWFKVSYVDHVDLQYALYQTLQAVAHLRAELNLLKNKKA